MANKFLSSASGGAGAGTGADWANAYTTLAAAAAGLLAGDTLFIGDDHNESSASAITATFPGTPSNQTFIYNVNHLVASPTESDLVAGAAGAGSIVTTGSSAITLNGSFYWRGAYILPGTGANNVSLIVNNSSGNQQTFVDSKLGQGGTSNGSLVNGPGVNVVLTLINTTWKASNTSAVAITNRGRVIWKNTNGVPAIDPTGSAVVNLIASTAGASGFFEGLDLSGNGLANKTLIPDSIASVVRYTFKDCKFHSGYTLSAAQTGPVGGAEIDAIHCSSGANYHLYEAVNSAGNLTTQTTVVRTGGATDGSIASAWKITTTARANIVVPFSRPIFPINSTTGADVTVTVEGIADPRDFSSLPTNGEFWIEVEYFGSSASPVGSFKSGAKSSPLASASALTASTQAWDSGATARANSTAYTAGDIRKVASNSGRLFICTTPGNSAGSEPAGYATAVDGDSITDGTAVFKAMWRFEQTVTLTSPQPQNAGPLTIRANVAKASINGIYVDPKPTLS